jgi:5S rRNA maturation endonuclease (ribonuclease M5)
MRQPRRAESAVRVIEELSTLDAGSQLIIVEGSKDKAALLKLGVKTKVMTLRSFLRLASTDWLERSEFSEVIVLTDFDRRGRFHSRTIKRICSGRVKVNTEYKGRLKQALGSWAKDVEGIPRFLRNYSGRETV